MSVGIVNRKHGDMFRNEEGNCIYFSDIVFYPDSGKLDKVALTNLVTELESKHDIKWTNTKTGRSGGVAIMSFTDETNTLYYGRYLDKVNIVRTQNQLPNKVGNYLYVSNSAMKARAKLSPQDLLTTMNDLDVTDIVRQLRSSLGNEHQLFKIADRLSNGEALPITFSAPKDVSFSAFRDYYCEILQPIALIKGQYTGNLNELTDLYVEGDIKDMKISFETAKNSSLNDSFLTDKSGNIVKISSKGGQGINSAMASSTSLLSAVNELAKTSQGAMILEKHSEVVNILEDIRTFGQEKAPLKLGLKYNLVDADDMRLLSLVKDQNVSVSNIDKLSLTDSLSKLAESRIAYNPEIANSYYHLIAAIAHNVADYVNKNTGFSEAACDILNHSALVQVYTKAKEKKDNWVLEQFTTVYPGDSIEGVYMTASKTYYSTGIKGNFTFKINHNK